MMCAQDKRIGSRILGREVPDKRCIVSASRDNPAAVGANCYAGDFLLMATQDETRIVGRVLCREVPDLSCVVITPRDNPAAVGTDRYSCDDLFVPLQVARVGGRVVGREIPNPRRLVGALLKDPGACAADRLDFNSRGICNPGLNSLCGSCCSMVRWPPRRPWRNWPRSSTPFYCPEKPYRFGNPCKSERPSSLVPDRGERIWGKSHF